MKALLKRLREPSSLAGIAGLAILFGLSIDEGQAIANAVAGVAGVAAIFLPEAKAE